MRHLGSLFLVEVGGAGVEHHGLDSEALGVLLPVALLHLALHLPDPCTRDAAAAENKPMSDRINPTEQNRTLPVRQPAQKTLPSRLRPPPVRVRPGSTASNSEGGSAGPPVNLPFATATTGTPTVSISSPSFLYGRR